MDVVLRRLPQALSVPSKAIFTQNGKPVVYVQRRGGFEAVQVEVEARNPDEAAVKGVPEGTPVAIVEPERKSS
jgi:hypothetical protein